MSNVKLPDIKLPDIKMSAVKKRSRAISNKTMPALLGNVKLPRLSVDSSKAARRAKNRLPGRRRGRPSLLAIVAGAAGGVALFYFMDPQRGAARRTQARDQIAATVRRLSGNLGQLGSRAGANANGFSQKMVHLRSGSAPVDDLTLRDRVESEIFRDASLPKGHLNFDVESGVVTIRGQVDNALQIASIEKMVLKVRGVNGVENLMHVAGTPAPNKVEARQAR